MKSSMDLYPAMEVSLQLVVLHGSSVVGVVD